jgi:polar amino acid transport system substrate-binding protein
MRGYAVFLLIGIMTIPFFCSAADIPQDIRFVTEEYYPLNFVDNGTVKGISVDLMEEILRRMGSDANRSSFTVLPWSEAYNLAKTTPDTALFTVTRIPEREDEFLWAGPFFTDRDFLYTHEGVNLSDTHDIAALKIAVVKDDRSVTSSLNAGADEKNLIGVLTAEEAISMVDSGSADAFAYGEYPGKDAIAKYAADPSRFAQTREIGSFEDYFAFNVHTPEEFVIAVNNTLKELKMDRGETGTTEYERIYLKYLPVGCLDNTITDEQLVDLVHKTIEGLQSDASGTLTRINTGESPYMDPVDRDLYVFVFDTNVTVVGNAANPQIVGMNNSGKPDALGRLFRDDMIAIALKDGKGWVDYVYSNVDSLGLYKKKSYVEICTGSDDARYIVGSGRYLNCDEIEE